MSVDPHQAPSPHTALQRVLDSVKDPRARRWLEALLTRGDRLGSEPKPATDGRSDTPLRPRRKRRRTP